MSTVMTMPGKIGDSLLQWPVAFWYGKQVGDFELWLDEKTCKPLIPLFEAQPHVSKVKLIPGVEHWNCGGQPFHFDLPTSAFEGNTIFHLGLRMFPQRQISLETMANAKVPINVSQELFSSTPSIKAGTGKVENRLVLHGQSVCPHNRQTPQFWKFLASVRDEIGDMFDDVVFVGNDRDREIGRRTYPGWHEFVDDGDFLKLADLIADSRAFIGVGSSPVALAGLLKVPAIRVHDNIADNMPRIIWSNLGENQLNDSELGLRKSWPEWRDRWLKPIDAGVATS